MLTVLAAVAAASAPLAATLSVAFEAAFPPPGTIAVRVAEDLSPGFPFDEAIPSWNVRNGQNGWIEVELRARFGDRRSKWFSLGRWTADAAFGTRESIDGQKDEDGDVLTDTLRLARAADALDVRVTLRRLNEEGPAPELSLLAVNFVDRKTFVANDQSRPSGAWGKTIEVPRRPQGAYPRGSVLCSPTSVSMTLAHWAAALGRPEIDRDVPELEQSAWDPVYRGAGNWPFNTALLGSPVGMKSYVARLGSIAELESWIAAGIPVVCSVALDLLVGRADSGTSGHLIVAVGFDAEGNLVANDPAFREVRKVYPRARFEQAWLTSRRTVYLAHPESAEPPPAPERRWLSR